ncbi:MAG: DNA internalization-related competence protein ComEC/Rec2, partial [Candidatus Rokubacteria bacterium]|nr:DNA internalization-related competence protein ComEC/Rec2 [Candidatus Rokubacteria bacterium]
VWAVALVWGASLVVLGRLAVAAAFLLAGVAAAGALRAMPTAPTLDHVARLALPSLARVEGRLVTEPTRFAPDRARILLDVTGVDDRPRSGRIQVTVFGELPPLAEGQRIRGELRLHRATGFRNPGVFDYAAYLGRQGILVVGTTRSERLTALDDPRPPWYARARRAALGVIERALPSASAALLEGLLLGERRGLPLEIDEAFRRAGVYHVLAVSGFNVALVAGPVFGLSTLAGFGRRPSALAAMVAIVGFALVAGPEPSVLRAVVMGVVMLGALLLDRNASVVNGLALAAMILLAAHPGDLADPGFQLSFAATGGIVLAPLPRGWLLGALGVSVAAQLAVLPIALVHFNQLSTIGVVANLGVVPLAGVATIVGFLAVITAWASETAGAVLLNATWPVLLALRAIVALAAAVPGALLHLPAPSWPATAAYGLALGLGLLAWRLRAERPERARLCAGGAGVLAVVAVALACWPLVRPAGGLLRLTMLDVGQGDAIVMETPGGRAVLIDAGPGGPLRLDAGERVVSPFLWNRGLMRLAAAVTTHDDQDHAGGMAVVRRNFSIGTTLEPGQRHWIDGVSIMALTGEPAGAGLRGANPHSPRSPAPVGSPVRRRNDDALVLRVDYGLASFLLTSDIPAATERALLASTEPLGATVLKVAHHGSGGSSTREFLERVRPRLALISVGARNPHGHPAPPVLDRLAATGARVYRTDRDGAVIVETDGAALTATRWATGHVDRYCLDPERVC